jgi:hypothetical protein
VSGYLVAYTVADTLDEGRTWLFPGSAFTGASRYDTAALPYHSFVHSAEESAAAVTLTGLSAGTEYVIAVLPRSPFGWGSQWSAESWVRTAPSSQCSSAGTPSRATPASHAALVAESGTSTPSTNDMSGPNVVSHDGSSEAYMILVGILALVGLVACGMLVCACACLLDRRLSSTRYDKVARDDDESNPAAADDLPADDPLDVVIPKEPEDSKGDIFRV